MAAVASSTASNLEELAIGMSRVASSANAMGVSQEQLIGMLSTIISVTREAPESVGVALKTIFARISDIEAGIDEDGVTLGVYTQEMADLGFNVLDANNELRDQGEVIEEIGNKWAYMTREQQVSLAQTMAGTRQYSKLIALFDNWDKYTSAVKTAATAEGTLQKQQDIYMQSTKANLNALQASAEDIFDSLLDSDTINNFAKAMTGLNKVIASFIDALGGGGSVLLSFGSIATTVFNKQLSGSIVKSLGNLKNFNGSLKEQQEIYQENTDNLKKSKFDEAMEKNNLKIEKNKDLFTDQQIEEYNKQTKKIAEVYNKMRETRDVIERIFRVEHNDITADLSDEDFNNMLDDQLASTSRFKDYIENAINKPLENLGVGTVNEKTKQKGKVDWTKKRGFTNSNDNVYTKKVTSRAKEMFLDLIDQIDGLDNALKSLYNNDVDNEKFKELKEKLKEMYKKTMEVSGTDAESREAYLNLFKELKVEVMEVQKEAEEEYRKKAQKAADNLKKDSSDTVKSIQQTEEILIEDLGKAGKELLTMSTSREMTQSLLNVVGGIGQIAAGLQNITNLTKIWENENTSTTEKVLQTFTGLSASIAQLSMGMSSLQSAKQMFDDSGFIEVFTEFKNKITSSEEPLKIITALVGKGLTAAFDKVKAVLKGAMTFFTSWYGLVLTAITVIITAFIYAAGEAEREAKRLQEQLELTTEQFERLNKQYEDFASTKNSLDSKIEQLSELKKGTSEYADTLEEVNNQFREMIKAYPELAQYVDYVNGQYMYSDEDAIDKYERALQRQADVASLAQSVASEAVYKNSEAKIGDYDSSDVMPVLQWLKDQGIIEPTEEEIEKAVAAVGQTMTRTVTTGSGLQVANTPGAVTTPSQVVLKVTDEEMVSNIAQYQKEGKLDKYYNDNLNRYEQQLLLDREAINNLIAHDEAASQYNTETQNIIANRLESILTTEEGKNLKQEKLLELQNDTAKAQQKYAELHGASKDAKGYYTIDENGERIEFNLPDDSVIVETVAEIETRTALLNDQVENIENNGLNLQPVVDALKNTENELGVSGIYESAIEFQATGNVSKIFTEEEKEKILDYFNNLSDEALQVFKENFGEDFIAQWLSAMNSADIRTVLSSMINSVTKEVDQSTSIIDTLTEKGWSGLSEDDIKILDKYEEKYEGLAFFRNKNEEDYIRYLREVRDLLQEQQIALEKQKTDLEFEDIKELSDSFVLNLDLDTEEALEELKNFGDQIEEYLDQEYELTIKVVESTGSKVQDIVNDLKAMEEAASLVGEGYRISAEDLETFAKGFPGVLAAAAEANQILTDGSIEVSEKLIEESTRVRDTEISNKKKSVLEDIQAERKKLIARAEAAEAAATQAKELADTLHEGQKLSEDQTRQYWKNIQDYQKTTGEVQIDNSETVSTEQQQDMEDVNSMAAQVGEDVSVNMQRAAASMSDSMRQASESSITSLAAVSKASAALVAGKSFSADQYISELGSKNITNSYQAQQKATVTNTKTESELVSQSFDDILSLSELEFRNQQAQWEAIAKANYAAADKLAIQEAQLKAAVNGVQTAYDNMGKGDNSGSSSSGKDSSDSAKDPDLMDYLEEEKDRYHDVNIQLTNLETALQRIQEEQSKLTGKELIANLNKQLDILEKQKETQNEKLNIARAETSEVKQLLAAAGAKFNEDGTLANYAELLDASLAKVNATIAAYNAMSAEQQEATGKAMVEAAEKEYEALKDNIERYDTLITETIPGIEDAIQNAINKQIELQIEKFKMKIEAEVELSVNQRDWNTFKRDLIDKIKEDDLAALFTSYLFDADTYISQIDKINNAIADTQKEIGVIEQGGFSDIFGDNLAAAQEYLEELVDQLKTAMTEQKKLIEDMEKLYVDSIKAVDDAFKDELDTFKRVSDQLEHEKNLIGMLYGDDAYNEMKRYYADLEANNNKQLELARARLNKAKEMMDKEEVGTEAWKAAKEAYDSAADDFMSLVESSLKVIIEKYENSIKSVYKTLNDNLTNGLGLDYVTTQWDLINKNAEDYYDTINRSYELQKLQNKFQDALNNNTGLKAQQQIKDLMDQQLGDLQARDKLTEYDVQRAEKLLEIELKKIALQDAQNNKSKMRLRRDASGNYSYQFVSDEEKIAQAQQDLANAQNELYNFDKSRYEKVQSDILNVYTEYVEKRQEIDIKYANDEEERLKWRALLDEQYQDRLNFLTEQNGYARMNIESDVFDFMAGLYDTNIENFKSMTDEQIQTLMNDYVPNWNNGIQAIVENISGPGGITSACETAFEELDTITQEYIASLEALQQAADYNLGEVVDGFNDIKDVTLDNLNYNEQIKDSMIEQYEVIRDSLLPKLQEMRLEMESMNGIAATLVKSYTDLVQKENEAKAAQLAKEAAEKAQNSANSSTSSGATGTGSTATGSGASSSTGTTGRTGETPKMSDLSVGMKVRYLSGQYYYSSDGIAPVGSRGQGKEVTINKIVQGAKYPISVTSTDSAYGWLKLDQLQLLKTGGYTGDWSDSGRLGILHQKELVLNASDTENILDAVEILRGLSDLLGVKTLSALSTALSSVDSSIFKDVEKENQILEQQVNITATFPNAKDKNEIEEAMKELVNTASQRVARRRF